MEFFAVADVRTTQEDLKANLDITSLPRWCASISEVFSDAGESGEIYSIWGQFVLTRQEINGGVRFTMPKCPNAFAWTVTTGYPPAPDGVVIHGTINRTEHDEDFIETLEDFVTEWKAGLEAGFPQK